MIAATQSQPASTVGKPSSTPRATCGLRRMRTVTSVMIGEQPFRAGQHADDVVEIGVEVLAAEPQDLAAHQHDLEARGCCWW